MSAQSVVDLAASLDEIGDEKGKVVCEIDAVNEFRSNFRKMTNRFEHRFDIVLPRILKSRRRSVSFGILHEFPRRDGVVGFGDGCGLPKEAGGNDVMTLALIVDGGHCKVSTHSFFVLRGSLLLIAFHHVVIHHWENFGPTHRIS